MGTPRLAPIGTPDFGPPGPRPAIPAAAYRARLDAMRERARARACDVAMWARTQARRAFMADSLGIGLHPDVLPFSNIPGCLPPYLLRPGLAMTRAR